MACTAEIERTVLASVMFSDIDDLGGVIATTELYEEWFTIREHKIIAKTINALLMKSLPTTMEMVLHTLDKNGLQDIMHAVIDVCTSTPIGSPHTFNAYINVIKRNAANSIKHMI